MPEGLLRLAESPCFAPLRILVIGSVTGAVAMLLGDFLYSRIASSHQERKRRFVTTVVAVCAFFGASYLFMLAEACALGPICSAPLEISCTGQSASGYRLAAAFMSFISLAIMCMELARGVQRRS